MTILHIDSSINGENSASRAISRSIVDQLKRAQWGEQVVYRDLAADPLPHLTLDAFADTLGARRVPRRGHGRDRRADVQFHAADPAQGVDRPHPRSPARPSATPRTGPRAWPGQARDHRAGARRLLQRGLAGGRARASRDAILRGVFNFIGIEPEFVVADGLDLSPEQRKRDRAGARRDLPPRRLTRKAELPPPVAPPQERPTPSGRTQSPGASFRPLQRAPGLFS